MVAPSPLKVTGFSSGLLYITTPAVPHDNMSMLQIDDGKEEDNRVERIFQEVTKFLPSHPPETSFLPKLTTLALVRMKITGRIPTALGLCKNLQKLDLSANALTGPIPSELALCSSLVEAKLFHNQLTGPLPLELRQLTTLNILHLHQNKFYPPYLHLLFFCRLKELTFDYSHHSEKDLCNSPLLPLFRVAQESYGIGYRVFFNAPPFHRFSCLHAGWHPDLVKVPEIHHYFKEGLGRPYPETLLLLFAKKAAAFSALNFERVRAKIAVHLLPRGVAREIRGVREFFANHPTTSTEYRIEQRWTISAVIDQETGIQHYPPPVESPPKHPVSC